MTLWSIPYPQPKPPYTAHVTHDGRYVVLQGQYATEDRSLLFIGPSGAVLTKDLARVQLLLEHSAKTTNRDENGLTALAWAQKIHTPQIVALLKLTNTRQ